MDRSFLAAIINMFNTKLLFLLPQLNLPQILLIGLVSSLGLCQTGCSSSNGRANPPKYNSNAGAEALAAFDTNRDGSISGDELNLAPSLKSSLKEMDTDNNNRLTAEEINARVKEWQNSRVAEMPVRCKVSINGIPINDLEVQFIPEDFLGSSLQSAKGTTTENGIAVISLPKEKLSDPRHPGVACGWYKISVVSNSKKIPLRYNVNTTLGCEVAMNANWVNIGAVTIEINIP